MRDWKNEGIVEIVEIDGIPDRVRRFAAAILTDGCGGGRADA